MAGSETLVDALLRREAFPHAADDIRLLETHISWVVLAGDFAYKIKKPLRLDFLDFSTLALRKHWCDEELRLNRRWAPTIYLDVVPISGSLESPSIAGTGDVIEYAVRMRRFPQSALLSEQLAAGGLGSADMLELAEMIADRHSRAPLSADPRFGGFDAVLKPMQENFRYLRPELAPAELGRFEAWTAAEAARQRRLIEDRGQSGFVRECHGDLHLRNLVRLPGEGIVAFDCIEFSDELRMLDVISDLSFLAMDLSAAGRDGLTYTLLNRYLECSGDYAGMGLYKLYFVYHCLIRAKVAAIRAGERDGDSSRQDDLTELHHYCDVARARIDDCRPALIVMHGYSGSGKTWLSTRLMPALGAIRLRSDIERKRIFGIGELGDSDSTPGGGLYDASGSGRTYARLHRLARGLLEAGHRVIIDAANLKRWQREAALEIAAELDVACVIVDVRADRDRLVERLETRAQRRRDASEADVRVLEYQLARADPLSADELSRVVPVASADPESVAGAADSVAARLAELSAS